MVLDFKGVFLQTGAANNGTVLTSPFFLNAVLPFVLVFTVLFAILQKSKILGEGKKQIDAIVSLIIALIVISFANAVGIITSLMPFLAVSVIVILVFLLLFSMVFQGEEFKLHKGIKWVIGLLVAVAVVAAVLIATGAWDYIRYEWLYGESGGAIFTNVIFLIIVLAAIAVVLFGDKWGGGGNKDK